VSINIRFIQATTRGDDTTLIKPFGYSNTSLYFSVFVLFVFGVVGRHSRAGTQEMTHSTRFYLTTRREGGGERCEKQHGAEPEEATKRFRRRRERVTKGEY